MRCSRFGGKLRIWENFSGLCYKLSTPVPPGSGSVTSCHAAEEAAAMWPPHGDRLLGVTNTCQTCSHPKMEINDPRFALAPFTWGEPYPHQPAYCSLSRPEHGPTGVPGSGKGTGVGTAHPERLQVTWARCHTYSAGTKPMLGVGSLWSCWKEASSLCLLELEKRPSAGSAQRRESGGLLGQTTGLALAPKWTSAKGDF